MVWPIHLKLFGLLAENEEDFMDDCMPSTLSDMKRLGREYMRKNQDDFKPTFYHKAMTFLMPSMRKLSIISSTERLSLYNDIVAYINERTTESQTDHQTFAGDRLSDDNFLESFVSFDTDTVMSADTEISRYLNEHISSQIDVSKWWFDHSTIYPNLYKLYLKLSCVPATSASSERNFSTTGNIITDKRSTLLPNNVNNLVILRNIL